MKRFEKICSVLEDRISYYIGGILLFVSIGYVVANVIGRYLFRYPVPNTTVWVALLMVPIVYLSLAYGWRKRGTFVAAEFLLIRMKGKIRLCMELFIQLCALLAFAILIGYGSLRGAVWAYETNATVGSIFMQVPTWPFRVIMALGCLLMFIRVILSIVTLKATVSKEEAEAGTSVY